MAKKRSSPKSESGFDKLARLIKNEGDDIRSDVGKLRAEVRSGFSKADTRFDAADKDLRAIHSELSYISSRLDRLEERVNSMGGYSKEIDELRSRIKDIEKHLGIARSA